MTFLNFFEIHQCFKDLLGRSLFDIIHPDDAELLKTQLLTSTTDRESDWLTSKLAYR